MASSEFINSEFINSEFIHTEYWVVGRQVRLGTNKENNQYSLDT